MCTKVRKDMLPGLYQKSLGEQEFRAREKRQGKNFDNMKDTRVTLFHY